MKIIMIGNGNTVYFLARVFMHQKDHVAIIHRDVATARDRCPVR
jgi:Trk K+ transport system NAD-binding subunit